MNLILADASIALKDHADEIYDSLITDPPAGISFMGKDWDKSDNFIESMTEIYKECLRVLKPGAHGLVWAIPRTSHWTATALERAGFEIRDVITHIFGSGFPKSLNIGKALPEWEGWGTALKPASEHWILVRKPLGESTVAKNVLKHGTGGINVDASRINTKPRTTHVTGNIQGKAPQPMSWGEVTGHAVPGATGRFPANFVLSHNEDCELVGTKEVKGTAPIGPNSGKNTVFGSGAKGIWLTDEKRKAFNNEKGKEIVDDWNCSESCAVAMLDEQSGVLKNGGSNCHLTGNVINNQVYGKKFKRGKGTLFAGDSGGASRFFYCAKASKRDRNEGLEDAPDRMLARSGGAAAAAARGESYNNGDSSFNKTMICKNNHPTVKSTKLMEYLIRLITPPNGTVLDPFMGSGSTGVAAKRLGFNFVGIEKEKDYFEIAKGRIG